jgi:hypothetical protein
VGCRGEDVEEKEKTLMEKKEDRMAGRLMDRRTEIEVIQSLL